MSIRYEVRILWPREGYGGGTRIPCESLIPAEVEKLVAAGYGRKHNPIHVIRHTEPEVILVKDDAPELIKSKLAAPLPALPIRGDS